ncbi:MAG: PEP-CTERM sorting domain-containing protein [Verrucomicrobia bacterium]|nr:PEP-CTERM sorting domain-containing protein [Verrucomicrobiota bacterium]
MKTPIRFLALGLVLSTCLKANTVLLTDTFSGNSLNSSLWNVSDPYGDSSTTVSGGYVTSNNRGYLTSTGSFTGALEIDVTIKLTGNLSSANLVWKTDGSHTGGSASPTSGISLGLYNESQSIVLGLIGGSQAFSQTFLPLPAGTWFDVKIVDDGSTVSAFLNGSTSASVQFSYTSADENLLLSQGVIVVYSRDSSYTGGTVGARMESIKVSSVPEASSTLALMMLSLAGVITSRRKFSRA